MADIGVAMGGGTDVAIETSDLVLMNSDMSRLQYAIGLAKSTVSNMRQNIIIAIGVVLVLLAAVILLGLDEHVHWNVSSRSKYSSRYCKWYETLTLQPKEGSKKILMKKKHTVVTEA